MYRFKSGDIVLRKCESDSLRYVGVVKHQDAADNVIVSQIMFSRDYTTKLWSLRTMDLDAYIDPKELTLLVPFDDSAKQGVPSHVVGVTIGKAGGHDEVRLSDGTAITVPVYSGPDTTSEKET